MKNIVLVYTVSVGRYGGRTAISKNEVDYERKLETKDFKHFYGCFVNNGNGTCVGESETICTCYFILR